VSIVTPIYNGESYVAACIESVLTQTYQNWEYIIVDNCSKDKSLEIVRSYARSDSRIVVLANPQHLRAVSNWNYSIGQMSPRSKYCKILHADDWLFPGCISEMVQAGESYPASTLIACYILLETSFVDRPCPDRRILNADIPYPTHVLPGRELGRR